ncbi:hypothetical protein [Burkholderia territorii]|uniref:hypothetical protein n=1 Tax=Burkholderia territorii TaxID=1503055 RepID=UPI00075DB84F|nr:hypothetical protein [Burkholderia territorii]KUZ40944.1 hypothetical protein WS52_12340 [Burkholderia territorii]
MWREAGEALLVGRRMHKADRAFKQWCDENGFDMSRGARADAMWYSLVWNPVNDPLTVPHNLTFPLACGQTPTDAKPTQSKLSGRADYYLKRAAMTPEELEAHDAANTEYAARVARETAERYFR